MLSIPQHISLNRSIQLQAAHPKQMDRPLKIIEYYLFFSVNTYRSRDLPYTTASCKHEQLARPLIYTDTSGLSSALLISVITVVHLSRQTLPSLTGIHRTPNEVQVEVIVTSASCVNDVGIVRVNTYGQHAVIACGTVCVTYIYLLERTCRYIVFVKRYLVQSIVISRKIGTSRSNIERS